MSKFIGRLCNLGIGKESSRGVGVAATYWLPKSTLSFDDKVQKQVSSLSYGNIGAFGNQSLVAQKWGEGDFESVVEDKSFGLLMLAALGTVSAASFNGAYKHTYTLQNDCQHDSLSLYVDEPSGDLLFELTMLEKMELEFTPDDLVKIKCEFKSKSSAATISTETYVTQDKFLGRHLAFKIAALASDLTAATAISLKSLKLTITKNLILNQVLGTVQPEDILNKQFLISGEFELDYESRAYANYMLDGSYKAMRLDCVNTDVTIGTTNPAFRFDLSRVEFDAWEVTRDNDELASQKIQFQALYDITNGNIINDCYVVNEIASY